MSFCVRSFHGTIPFQLLLGSFINLMVRHGMHVAESFAPSSRMETPARAVCRLRRGVTPGALLAAVLLLLRAASAHAHDFWIEPHTFHPTPGATVNLRLFVGQDFQGEPILYIPEQFVRFVSHGPDGERPVAGVLGDDPAGRVRVPQPGLYVIGYYSRKSEVRFDSYADFEKYLVQEGLERHRVLAQKRAKLRGGVLELFSRCVKALVKTGVGAAPPDRVLGFPLELVAETHPQRGMPLAVRLRYHGAPLADALVIAFNKRRPLEKIKVRTDKQGRAALPLGDSGTWLITSVHMIPASLLARPDWESFWASLTFELP
jgi:uncharacterized GH25 family protein